MKSWVIPYTDQPLEFWQSLEEQAGNHIEEVFFPMPQGGFASGRSRQAEVHLEEFLSHSCLPKAVLINPIVLPEPIAQIGPRVVQTLNDLYGKYGIKRVTITSLELARMIRKELPFFHITASCLMGISTAAQCVLLGQTVDALTPDTRLNHDLAGLKKLKAAFKGQLRLLVNESCLPGCPMRMQHFYEMAYSETFPLSLCQQFLQDAPWLRLTSGWILPQHLHFYDEIADFYKLAGRVTLKNPDNYRRVLLAYLQRAPLQPVEIGGGPASVDIPLEIPDRFFETIINCPKNCTDCSFCRDFYPSS